MPGAHEDVVEHGHPREGPRDLERASDAALGSAGLVNTGHVAAVDGNRSTRGFHLSRDD